MGQKSNRRVIILLICLAFTGLIIHYSPKSVSVKKKIALHEAAEKIPGWYNAGFEFLDPRITDALKLDDYINNSYSKGKNRVDLYVGYYFSTKKVGAAHDPLVCFPGQGWEVSDIKTGKFVINENIPLNFSEFIANRGQQKFLILYWFQSGETTNDSTYAQKLSTFKNKYARKGEDNAFVRISTPLDEKSENEGKQLIFEFINAFYPVFLQYIHN